MAKTFNFRHSKTSGIETTGPVSRKMRLTGTEGKDGFFSALSIGQDFETVRMGHLTSDNGVVIASSGSKSGPYTGTFSSGGSIASGSDGLVLTTGTTSGYLASIRHDRRIVSTLFSGSTKVASAVSKTLGNLGTITTCTAILGFHNSSTDPFTTAPTNGVFFYIANGAIVGRVRGASGSVADTATLATLAAGTNAELDIKFGYDSKVGAWWGEFWVNGTRTAMTTAQLTQLAAINADLYHHLSIQTNTTAARTLVIDAHRAEYDRP